MEKKKVQATLWSSTSNYSTYVDFVHTHEIKAYTYFVLEINLL